MVAAPKVGEFADGRSGGGCWLGVTETGEVEQRRGDLRRARRRRVFCSGDQRLPLASAVKAAVEWYGLGGRPAAAVAVKRVQQQEEGEGKHSLCRGRREK